MTWTETPKPGVNWQSAPRVQGIFDEQIFDLDIFDTGGFEPAPQPAANWLTPEQSGADWS